MLWAMPNQQGRTVDSKSGGPWELIKPKPIPIAKVISEEKQNDTETETVFIKTFKIAMAGVTLMVLMMTGQAKADFIDVFPRCPIRRDSCRKIRCMMHFST